MSLLKTQMRGLNLDFLRERDRVGFSVVHTSICNSSSSINSIAGVAAPCTSYRMTKSTFNKKLLRAIAQGDNPDRVEGLLVSGADIHIKDSNFRTMLHHACSRDRIQTAKLLLDKGADVNSRDISGHTPLMVAASCRAVALVALLLERGADVNSRAVDGWTALDRASLFGHKEIVAALLCSRGALLNGLSKNSWTRLHEACVEGQKRVLCSNTIH